MVQTTKLYHCSENFLHNITLGGREGTESIISMSVSELGTGCNWLSTLVSVVMASYYNWLRAMVLVLKTGWNYHSASVFAVLETVRNWPSKSR
jgi:hypothetical protein